jgi:hypothetical protein
MLRNLIIFAGVALLVVGLFWPVVKKIPLFRLPGDIAISRPGTKIYFPITSMIVISVVLTLVLKLLRKF